MMRQLRRITDSRLAAPWKRRHSTAIRDVGQHDAYRDRGALPEPSVCRACRALFAGGRWTWETAPANAAQTTCPACRRIEDRFPAGFLTLSGAFLGEHREEIVNLARNRAELERQAHPLNRVATWEEADGEIRITTTDTHTPRRIAEAIHDAYHGELAFEYLDDDSVIRVRWAR